MVCVCRQVEKLRYNQAYEFLLPKGYQTCDSIPEVLSTPSYKTKCQVREASPVGAAGWAVCVAGASVCCPLESARASAGWAVCVAGASVC